jgi:hypothetical protein
MTARAYGPPRLFAAGSVGDSRDLGLLLLPVLSDLVFDLFPFLGQGLGHTCLHEVSDRKTYNLSWVGKSAGLPAIEAIEGFLAPIFGRVEQLL